MPTPIDWIADATRDLQPLTTLPECAKTLRMSERNLRRLIAAGRIAAVKSSEGGSSRVLVPRTEVAKFLARCAGVQP
jgi:excisionase family DNA binding protein